MHIREAAKYLAYRTPGVSRFVRPHYPYKVNPGQLSALVQLIDDTREVGGSVVEIGVAQGYTSAYLLEHMRTVGDSRKLLLFDTFSGFTQDSIDHEITARGKEAGPLSLFRYGSEDLLRENLRRAGHYNFETFKGDAAQFDWQSVAPISVVLLDIDVYKPTRQILNIIWPLLTSPGGIVVDDCLPDGPWDGSLQACEEFLAEHALAFRRVGGKGALIEKT